MKNADLKAQIYFWSGLGLTFIVGIGLRLWGIGNESLRLDEAQSVWQASHSFDFIFNYMLKNVHLPLHNSLLHVWMTVFGTSEIAVRLLATIPGILFLPAIYFLTREFLNRNYAFLATLFSSLSPFFIWYSQEIRMYSLLTLVTTLSYLSYLRILRTNKFKWFLAYFLVNLIGIYTHYFFLLVLFVQAVFFILSSYTQVKVGSAPVKKQFFGFLTVAFLLFASFMPWLYGLYSTYDSGSLAPIFAKPTSFNMVLSLYEFIFGFQPDMITGVLIALWPILILLGFLFLHKNQKPPAPEIWLLFLGVFLPIIIVFILSITLKPMYLTRYLTIAAPFTYILVVWFISILPSLRVFYSALFSFLLLSTLFIQETSPTSPAKEEYREAVSYLQEEAGTRDVIVLAPPYLIYPFQYYYEGTSKVTSLPIWDKRKGAIPIITDERLAADAVIIKGSHKRILLLVANDLLGAAEARNYFDKHLTKLDKKQFSRNLWVHTYQAEYLSTAESLASGTEGSVSGTGVILSPSTGTASATSTIYIVIYGDTLSLISKRYYGDLFKFKELAEWNNIENPDLIRPGQVIHIYPLKE